MQIAIVEDEGTYAQQLAQYIQRFAQENQFLAEVTVFSDGAQLVGEYRPCWDLILLDIDMPTMDGITTAHAIRRQDAAVLLMFVTNLAQYAIKGYEVDALDYVLKPVCYQAFSLKMKKVLRIWRISEKRCLFLKKDGGSIRIPLSHLFYIEVTGHKIIYHTTDGEYTVSGTKTLTILEEELQDAGFCRCNSCYLVNLRFVDGMPERDTVLVAGDALTISRGRRKSFTAALLDFAKGIV